jgi:two-component system CheB/CheR fusion protein
VTEPDNNHKLDLLLDHLRRTRGFDFSAYKRPSLQRRLQKRMQVVSIERYSDYLDYLEVHPDEFGHLFNTILINVTDFFRDEGAWRALGEQLVARILAGKAASDPIRVWSAGCAAGQEAFTIAMVLAEALGDEPFRERVKIYATDVDDDALNQARQGAYTERETQNIPAELRQRYFESVNERLTFRKDLRRAVIFGRHDLLQDAPISRVDLLVCRNTLMYFNAEAQNNVLERFEFALNDYGLLFLGKSEVLMTRSDAFLPVDLKHRLFARAVRPRLRERPAAPAEPVVALPVDGDGSYLRDLALEADPTPTLIVDANSSVVAVNAAARHLFGWTLDVLGRSLPEAASTFHPVDVTRLVEKVTATRAPASVKDVVWPCAGDEARQFEVSALPLIGPDRALAGIRLDLIDTAPVRALREQLGQLRQEIETSNEELQASNEELETTNEELQSTVEEFETTNEELQSTNEELETMNEELQSANEELQAVNDELRVRTQEVHSSNAFLGSVLSSLRDGVVVLDRGLRVQTWNYRAEDLWGVRADEVRGQNFLELDIGLPVDRLKPMIRSVLADGKDARDTQAVVPATNRRGRHVQIAVSAAPLTGHGRSVDGVILVMEERTPEQPA